MGISGEGISTHAEHGDCESRNIYHLPAVISSVLDDISEVSVDLMLGIKGPIRSAMRYVPNRKPLDSKIQFQEVNPEEVEYV